MYALINFTEYDVLCKDNMVRYIEDLCKLFADTLRNFKSTRSVPENSVWF
jgi:hypothetical protein